MNPRDVTLVEKFMEMLKQQTFILNIERSCTPRPPFFLELQTSFQAAFGGFFEFSTEPLHKQCFLYLSICLITVLGKRYVHIVKVGNALITAFVICNLPASLKKEEMLTSLLSRLETRGQKSTPSLLLTIITKNTRVFSRERES